MVDNSVKGKTAVYGVIGCPIEHTFSPAIHNTMAKTLNKDMIYEAFRVEKDNLESAIKGAYSLGIKGLNVTVPHKVEVMKCLCDIDKRAKVIGAVNTLKYTENGYVGYNTDIIGVYYAIKNKGFDVKGKTVLLLGAGGAGNACGVMAADKGAKMLYIANRTVSKADKLAESIRAEYPDTEIKTLSIDDIYDIPNVPLQDCVACGSCAKTGKCVFDDCVNEFASMAKDADGFIFGTPVYYAHPTGKIQSFMDRVFYSAKSAFVHKPAAVISSSRRAGSVTSMDVLNKHLSISEMPIVTSNYWNEVHGHTPSDVEQDREGLDTMYALGKNMAWMLKCIEAGKKAGIEIPQNKKRTTNFIR